jgi:drug/metabolite transporter (DMT)-like permease
MRTVILCTLGAAFIYGTSPLFERMLLKGSEFPLSVGAFSRVLFALIAALVLVLASGDLGKMTEMGTREYIGFGILGILGSLAGPYLLFHAYRQPGGNITLIGPLLATFPIFTVVCGYFFLGEPVSRLQVAGIIMTISGAIMISVK